MCCQIFGERSTAPSSGRFWRRPAAPLLCWLSLRQQLLTNPTCLCICQTKKQKKYKFRVFFSIFYHNFFLTISTSLFVRKICLKSLNQIYRYLWTADSPVVKTSKKDWKKLTIKTWSQNLGSMAGLGLKICRRMLTNCCFWYFLAIFFSQ